MQIQAEKAEDEDDEMFGDEEFKKKDLKKKGGDVEGFQIN